LGHGPDMLRGNVDDGPLDRLVSHPVDDLDQHLRLARLELEPLTPHRLDEHRQLQFASTRYLDYIGGTGRAYADADVAPHLLLQPFSDLAGGEMGPVAPG